LADQIFKERSDYATLFSYDPPAGGELENKKYSCGENGNAPVVLRLRARKDERERVSSYTITS
jgi:hypothetical protein